METSALSTQLQKDKRRKKRLYKFCAHHITRIKPDGNLLRCLECPAARSGHRIVFYKGNVYAFGGYSPRDPTTNELIQEPNNRFLFKELWKFNVATKTWFNLKTTGSMPSELASHSAVLINQFMLVYGGTGVPFGESSSNSTHLCNLDTLEWYTLETTGDKPDPLYGQAISVYDNKMYAVGGTSGYEYSITVHCLDLKTKEWTRLDNKKRQNDQPPERYRHEIVVYNNKIFLFGGGTTLLTFGFKEIPVFSLIDNTWSKVETTSSACPEPRLCHGCLQDGSDVFICGGHNNGTIYDDIWKINLDNLSWIKLKATLSCPVYFHSAAISSEGQAFIFGGVTNTLHEIRTNNIFTVWLKIPSLSEMCWQAVLTYIPNIAEKDKEKLLAAGIPRSYLNQVDFNDFRSHHVNQVLRNTTSVNGYLS